MAGTDLLSSVAVRPERLRRATDASLPDRIPTAADRLHLSPSPLSSELEGHEGIQVCGAADRIPLIGCA